MDQQGGSSRQDRQADKRTVCEFWVRGQCMKGDTCGFLHENDPDRMPVCRNFKKNGFCNEPGCPFKHTLDDVKECNMYRLGFCVYGKQCSFRHTRFPGPPPDITKLEAAKPKALRDEDTVKRQANPNWDGSQRSQYGHRPSHMALPPGALGPESQQLIAQVGQGDLRYGW